MSSTSSQVDIFECSAEVESLEWSSSMFMGDAPSLVSCGNDGCSATLSWPPQAPVSEMTSTTTESVPASSHCASVKSCVSVTSLESGFASKTSSLEPVTSISLSVTSALATSGSVSKTSVISEFVCIGPVGLVTSSTSLVSCMTSNPAFDGDFLSSGSVTTVAPTEVSSAVSLNSLTAIPLEPSFSFSPSQLETIWDFS